MKRKHFFIHTNCGGGKRKMDKKLKISFTTCTFSIEPISEHKMTFFQKNKTNNRKNHIPIELLLYIFIMIK